MMRPSNMQGVSAINWNTNPGSAGSYSSGELKSRDSSRAKGLREFLDQGATSRSQFFIKASKVG
jgi:hypothetical protein